ncbi:MAG: transposase [Deltaproteobacteria bacterium]|nr:transposase [Deltaproteobacteria bacterium]
MPAPRCAYDHRLRDLACEEGDPSAVTCLGVPRSTAVSWIRRGPRDVISADLVSGDALELQTQIVRLQRRIDLLLAVVRLLFMLVRLSGARLNQDRLPEGSVKATVLDAISRATKSIPLAIALRVLGLSSSRYHAWRKLGLDCLLDDRQSCPKTSPTQLTAAEISSMHELVTDEAYRHVPVSRLVLLAQRLKKVVASPATWRKLIRERGWLRPRRRLYPEKPTEGLRASKPNEYWHIDVTVIRLLDGKRVYLHAVIDNFSRRILGWKAALRLEPKTTCAVLEEAAKTLPPDGKAAVVTDSGVENVNSTVDALLDLGRLHRILAQVDISFSNSMIEAWWRSLKHHWLYLNQLDSLAAVERLVAFYVEQHNSVLPHSAFAGQTPDEVFFGTGANVPDQLAQARRLARQARIAANRSLKCVDCRPPTPMPPDSSITPDSRPPDMVPGAHCRM